MNRPPAIASERSLNNRKVRANFLREVRSLPFAESAAIVADCLVHDDSAALGSLETGDILCALRGFGPDSLEAFYADARVYVDPSAYRLRELGESTRSKLAGELIARAKKSPKVMRSGKAPEHPFSVEDVAVKANHLPENHRKVLALVATGIPAADVAKRAGETVDNVYQIKSRFVKSLKGVAA